MIKKRASKKLLAGLGASIAFSTTAFISGLGVKAIINNVNNNAQELRFNRINEANFSQIPNLSTPTRDMFIDTTRLGNFHAGSVRKGQTLTPWGWLGLYTENNQASSTSRPLHQKLALTAWNGEILWTNDEYQGQSFVDNKADIFDIKYDWNTDLIFLARSGNPNGLFKPLDYTSVGENSLIIDVLDAQTGQRLQRIENNSGSTNDLHDFAWKSFFAIRDHFFDVNNDIDRIQDLYNLDITSKQSGQALAFYMPNFMQLYQKSSSTGIKQGTLPNFAKVLELFPHLTRGWIFDRTTSAATFKTRTADPLKSNQINNKIWTFTDQSNQTITLNTNDFYLLANPFWTATNQNEQFVLHFIVANDVGDVYHKIIGFDLVSPNNQNNQPLSQFDKTEKIASAGNSTNNILNIKLKPNQWGNNAASWNLEFINANLRINKNIFDNNIMTFAIPVAASQNNNGQKNFPIFDVVQLKINDQGLIDSTNSNGKLSSRVFDLGNQILNANNVNNINPWPDTTHSSVNHNYNRLISVSPFDNTFIYNAMPNLQGVNTNAYNANDVLNKFLSFWLVNGQTGEFKPFVISNDASLKGIAPQTILRINEIVKQGFTFDLKSLDSSGAINLYFNHSGSDRNGWYDSPNTEGVGMRSAKIGLLDDVIGSSSTWLTNITNPISDGSNKLIQVSDDSFATLIHSRANMTKWYARTVYNFDHPGNLWKANEQINSNSNNSNRVKATVFGSAITDTKVQQQDGVDLVSHWQVGQGKYNGNSSNQTNYNRLVVKRPVIRTGSTSTPQVLPITTTYEIDSAIGSKYQNLFNFNDPSTNRLTFTFNQSIENASWEIFSSWSQDAKITNYATSSDNVNFTSTLTNISGVPQWFDARANSNINANFFGKVHNAISPNTISDPNQLSLRTMLQIDRPANAPAWLKKADNSFFQAYPIAGSEYGNETNFQTILNRFIAWKAANVDLAENQEQKASGLANLTIKAFLQVNPHVIKPNNNVQASIYKKNQKQILLLDNKGQAIIYHDQYNDERIIYDQSATEYEQMQNYGYGASVQTKLAKSLQNPPSPTTKLLINVDLNDLSSTLLRKSATNNDAVFSVEYQSQALDKLVIKAANSNDEQWFKNRFSSFNKMLNLFPVFEYQTKNDTSNDQWKPIEGSTNKLWTDAELKTILQQNNNQLVLNTDKTDIKKVRIRLASKTNNGVPDQVNDFIKWNNWDENSAKLVSSIHTINPQKIFIDKNWFDQTVLSLADNTNTLDQLKTSDINQYETALKNLLKAANSNSDAIVNQIEIKYTFEQQDNLSAAELVQTITDALNSTSRNDKGIFALWNGTQGLKIKVRFQLKSGVETDFAFVDTNGNAITDETGRSGDLKSDIKTNVDLSQYFNQLETTPLQATKGAQLGQLTNFELPRGNAGKFNNQTYHQIKTILNGVGLDFQFQEWNNNSWSGWVEKDVVANYNPQDPAVKIGLKITSGWNIKVVINTTIIDDSYSGIKAQLHLPKLVKADQSIWETFKKTNPFSGNTYQLNIDNVDQAETILKQELIKFNNQQSPGSDFQGLNDQIEIKYRLGTNGQFKSAQELKNDLEQQSNQDQTSNQISYRLFLNSPNVNEPDFELEQQSAQQIQELLPDGNLVVKKFLHGEKYETEFDQINVTGSDKTNLTYTYGPNIEKIVNQDPSVGSLKLEWTYNETLAVDLLNSGQDPLNEWVNQPLPSSVNGDIKKIYVRITNSNKDLYIYGPDENIPNSKTKGTIDLSQIATIVQVNKDWIKNTPLSSSQINISDLNETILNQWKDQVLTNISLNDQDLLKQITLKFTYNGQKNLTANALVNLIQQELVSYDETHLGIIQLWDGQNSGLGKKIQATFTTVQNNSLVKLQDINGSSAESDLTNDINTASVITKVDLSSYINVLTNTKTNVVRPAGTPAGQFSSFTPPAMPNAPQQQFAGKTYDQISARLEAVGINVEFAKALSGPWLSKDKIKEYDARGAKLYFSFTNNSQNIELEINSNLIIGSHQDNKQNPLALQLNVPKQISIIQTDLDQIQQKLNFGGTTKAITFNENAIAELIKAILDRNAAETGDQDFTSAPLKMQFQIGNLAFSEADALKELLKNHPDDLPNRVIKYQFLLESTNDQFELIGDLLGTQELYNDNDSPLKIYINDKQIRSDLRQTTFAGSNKQLEWLWQNDLNVDEQTGVLSGQNRAQGLRIEFTLNQQASINDAEGTDLESNWVRSVPKAIDAKYNKIYLRLRLTDDSKYTYDFLNDKITLDLSNIKQIIDLEGSWLNQSLISATEIKLSELTTNHFDTYEQSVFQAATAGGIDANLINKIAISYSFNNKVDLTKDALFNEIKNYQNSHQNTDNLGILQLWNNDAGEKITANFTKADPGGNYDLNVNNPDNFVLDTSKVQTEIDLSQVLTWLQTITVGITEDNNRPNGISALNIPKINAVNDSIFHDRSWQTFEEALKLFGVGIEYRPLLSSNQNNESGWGNDQSAVNEYDTAIGKFQIRFKFNPPTSQNILLKISDQQSPILGNQNISTSSFDVLLAIRLNFTIQQNLIDTFLATTDLVSGDTKRITINQTAENDLIDAIKSENAKINPLFQNAPLVLQYYLGDQASGSDDQWRTLSDFQSYLAQQNTDQITNKIWFRFNIAQNGQSQFSVNLQPRVLHEKETPNANIKVKYFINKGNWESQAAKLVISGTNTNLKWNFAQIFNNNVFEDAQTGKVFLTTGAGQALQVQFTTKTNANYNDTDVSDDLDQLNNSWVTKKPTEIAPNIKSLKIRLVAQNGFIYEPAILQGNEQAQVHEVEFRIQVEIKLDKNWFNEILLVDQRTELKNLNQQLLNIWQEKIYQKISQANNNIDLAVAKKVKIQFIYNGGSAQDATEFLNQLQQEQADFNGTNLGIVQLWNGTQGNKLAAVFSSDDTTIIIKDAAGNQNDFIGDVNVSKIFTEINLTQYVQILETVKTTVNRDAQAAAGTLISFNPPNMSAGSGFLNGKSYDEIATRLEAIGIDIVFSTDGQNDWKPKEQIKNYNVQTTKLFIAFRNQANNNIDIKLDDQNIIGAGQASETIKQIGLPLNVPKLINIQNNDLNDLVSKNLFSGDTKEIQVNTNEINDLITRILQRNASDSGDNTFLQAPLKLYVKVGQTDFVASDSLENYLNSYTEDLNDKSITYKFVLDSANLEEWNLAPGSEIEHILYNNSNSPLAFYINEKTWEADAKNVQVQGNNENLNWIFANWNVSEINNEQLIETATGLRGLRIEFTTQENPNYTDAVATDPNADLSTHWVNKKPSMIAPETKKLFIRLKAANGFVYGAEKKNKATVHEINLTTLQIILKVDPNWISSADLQLSTGKNFVTDLTESIWNQFSQTVLANFNPNNLRDKLAIKFSFNQQNDLDAIGLMRAIENYLNDKSNSTKGYLQLFNGHNGMTIKAKFVSLDSNKYLIQNINGTNDPIEANVNTASVKTLIDLREYAQLLQSQPLQISKTKKQKGLEQFNHIVLPNFPDQLSQTNFANQDWTAIEPILNGFGITLEAAIYENATAPTDVAAWKPWNEVKQYDSNIGKIWFRFKVDQNNAGQNIVLSILNEQDVNLNLQSPATSAAFSADLNVPLKLDVPASIINDFISKKHIGGNTKFLTIDVTKENDFINEIIDFNKNNNQKFEEARNKLKLEYIIGDPNNGQWQERAAFINTLKTTDQDQLTNKISFRLVIQNQPNQTIFEVEPTITTAVEETLTKNAQVKIYAHEQGLETLASQIQIQGTNNKFNYQYPTGLNLSADSDIQGRRGLKLQYSTKPGITNDYYDQNNASTMNPQLGWTNNAPNSIDAQDRYLAVQIVAIDGYVYGADYAKIDQQDQSPQWSVHQVDVSQIKSEIKLSNNGLDAIKFNSTLPDLNINQIKQLEVMAKNQAQFEKPDLKDKVKVEYKIIWNNNWNDQGWVSIEQLELQIKSFMNDWTNNTLGLLKFNHQETTAFASINAHFITTDPDYIVIDQDATGDQGQQSAQNGKILNTNQLISPVDLKTYTQILQTEFIEIPKNASQANIQGFKPPSFNNNSGAQQFAGRTFDEIEQALNKIGILVEFIAPDSNATQNNWVSIDQIVDLNKNNELFLRFRLDQNKLNNQNEIDAWKASFAISTKQDNDGWNWNNTIDPNDKTVATEPIKLRIDLPITLTTDSKQLETAFNNKFQGNTFKINQQSVSEIKQQVNQLIQTTLANNSTSGTNVDQAPLKILFSLDRQVLVNPDQIWFEIDQLATILALNKTNWNTNKIEARWFINSEQPDINGQKYLISDDAIVTAQNQNNSANAPLKMFIHDQPAYSNDSEVINALTVSGSNQDYQINSLDEWIANVLPQGLQIEFSNQNPSANNWITYVGPNGNLPKPLNLNKELWMHYQVKSGYEYQNVSATNPGFSDPVQLDTSQIKTIIKLKKTWLELIKLTGNTKALEIDETIAQQAIIDEQVLPNGQNDLVKFEYSIDGQNWFLANQFKTLLQILNGAKDAQNFILKREEIQVRFNLKAGSNNSDQYQMEIDGDLIDNSNWNNHNVSLITNSLNQSVKGYIEVNHLKNFIVDNFAIEGSNTQPKLIVKKKLELETMMQNYASDGLFDILITGQQTNGSWDFSQSISILTADNKFVDDNELVRRGFQLEAHKKVALKFVAKNNDYEIYYQGNKQNQGYLLDISDNVRITFEIINPFVANQKTLALWWTEDLDKTKAKYLQGQGGFKIVNGKQDGTVDEANFISSLAWLKSANSGLADKEKEVLEFVYHIYDGEPTNEEIAEIGSTASINNYNDDTWKSLEPVLEQNATGDFTTSLNLKVGQYVSVALRVKQEYATGNDVYTLKDDQHSFMTPITADARPGRAHGYKIQADALEIDKDQIALENMLNSEQAPLDGYTNIKRLILKKDQAEFYKGVDLELQLFHEFHKGSNKEEILISPFDKIKLVKREMGNAIVNDYFKDASGNEFKDDQGQSIPILVDEQGRPLAPKLQSQPTITQQFTNYGDGVFGLTVPTGGVDRDKWGLFRNETINVVFKAQTGIGGPNEPDFILEGNKTVDLQNEISDQIKFPIFNQNNIKYEFNHADFAKDQVQFENVIQPDEAPIDGKSKVKTLIKLNKTTSINPDGETIEGTNADDAVKQLKNEIIQSFGNQLRFETIYEKKDGGTETRNDLDLYKLNSLQNNDRIKIRLVSANDDFIWAEPPKPLTIHVNGLVAKAPNRNRLQFLRVEQSGELNGQGSFKVLVNNPQDPNSDDKEILDGWKFVVRVWDEQKQIKHQWTDDQSQITNLKNGDKIEWKLLDQFDNPVNDAYYNTIAGNHELNSDGSIKLIFNEVNYPQGSTSAEIVNRGIGQYPDDSEIYPEKSGFVISNLKEDVEIFEINDAAFAKAMIQLEPHYVGINGQGRINFKATYLDNNYYVNSQGELYQKNDRLINSKHLKTTDQTVDEISLDKFLTNVTFYTSDPNLVGYQNGFKFVDNETNIDNQLHNGDEIWAQFDLLANNNEINQGVNVALGPVSGLQEVVTDQMSTLWYVMMALGGILTLGGLTALVALLRRHKKLKR